ncbi:MAG: isoleucine--tRNA ligase [Crocinitomicaceae bacterium]|nr:isoleucine--tRNA ligase [Crocinitomicaceae bacterium]
MHHVMARALKDLFCRYKTLKGFRVNRKAGWDTHGLPVELGVEKELGITKEDIGKKITVDQYNIACKKAVMKYTDIWNNLTKKMGYWVDMENPYVTYENKYIESVWWLIGQLYKKDLMYKGYTIQPFSPAAGTGLSSHELNQPGTYKDVKDTTVVAQFKLKNPKKIGVDEAHFLAWTTTPWTLPSNTALAVGKTIDYILVKTINQYTDKSVNVILAKNLLDKLIPLENEANIVKRLKKDNPNFSGDYAKTALEIIKNQRQIIKEFKGEELVDIKYEQLLPYALPYENAENAFKVIAGDFVTTEDGTGIVHIAPTFGQDDALVAKEANVPPMLVLDENQNPVPLVDLQGKFRPEMGEFSGKYVKNEYYSKNNIPEKSVDVELAIKLKTENKAFRVEKYEHSYPHCWRTDKPVLYYPLDSWFIKVSQEKEKLVSLNRKINWKPKSTGVGRFGNWLENANDWNLSRSRYWGIPIPIWRSEDGTEEICISSVEQLKMECEKAVVAGLMDSNPLAGFVVGDMSKENYDRFDLHKNYVDSITLVSPSNKPMYREKDLIDVWFDSGSMPFAQWHYPFENTSLIENQTAYPADFIAEGVDQTRGWFYTLHTISSLVFNSVAYKNVISNGLVLDKNGQKMSKRLGNAIDPFETLSKYGPDATRWYMITNAQPWDNLKFDLDGITEVQRKFFGTLYNTYGFLALYANVDGFKGDEKKIPINVRPEIDRWIISKLNSLIAEVDTSYENYEPTKAGRAIQLFVINELSNWYVRLCRRRFWKGDYTEDKIAAYQTLHECLLTVSILASPIAPFYCDKLYRDLTFLSSQKESSVHLCLFPKLNRTNIHVELEEKMAVAQNICSLVLGLRKKEKIKVRQPLQKLIVPVEDAVFKTRISAVENLILSELNIKELELIPADSAFLDKKIKPNFKTIGPKYGKQMKGLSKLIADWGNKEIRLIEKNKGWSGLVDGSLVQLSEEDLVIETADIPGFLVASEGGLTVALDVQISKTLKEEGLAREFVNRIQNHRKEMGLNVTDKINISLKSNLEINQALNNNLNYICSETLANSLEFVDVVSGSTAELDLGNGAIAEFTINKLN